MIRTLSSPARTAPMFASALPVAPLAYGDEEADLIFMIAAPEGEHNFHVKAPCVGGP